MSAWGKPAASSWADDEVDASEHPAAPPSALAAPPDDFPALGEAVKAPPPKSKKTKPAAKKLGLGEFLATTSGKPGPIFPTRGGGPVDDKAILMSLPTAPRPRVEGEVTDARGQLGGAFKEYGGDRGGFGARREDRRGPRNEDSEYQPSRADEVNDWGAERKFQPSADRPRGGFRERDSGFGPRPASAADEVDDWGATRKFQPSADERRRGPGGGFGEFREADGAGARRGPMFEQRASRADEEDEWSRGRQFQAAAPPPERSGDRPGRSGFGFSEGRGGINEDRWGKQPAPEVSSAAPATSAPAERPRLQLAPRTKPVEQPEPSTSAEATTSEQQPPKPKSNPFGTARPREEVLTEKGVDWKKEELKLEHGEVIRETTEEEEALVKEVEALRIKLEALKTASPESDDTKETAKDLDDKERALYKLQAELDDAVKYAKRAAAGAPATAATAAAGTAEPEKTDSSGAWTDRTGRRTDREGSGAAREGRQGSAGPRDGPRDAPRDGGSFGPRRDGPRRDGPPKDGQRGFGREDRGRAPAPAPARGGDRW